MILKFPLSPSLNAYYQHFSRFKLSEAGESFRHEAGWIALERTRGDLLSGNLDIEINLVMRGGDIDNREKALFDALNQTLWQDDSQIVRMLVTKRKPLPDEEEHITVNVKEFQGNHSWKQQPQRWMILTYSGLKMRRERKSGTNV